MSQKYHLTRDTNETKRLNEQHILWTDTFGYLIHPSITPHLPTNSRIADLATGTAAWALSAATAHPTAQITGFDISDAQFPPRPHRPSNVSLTLHDIHQPFQEELQGTFDLVHARLLLSTLPTQDAWNTAVAHAQSLLKPGGWIQWTEADFTPCWRPVRRDALGVSRTSALRKGFGISRAMTGGRTLDVPDKLMAAFERAGMLDVDIDMVASDRLGERGRREISNVQVTVLEGMMKQWREDKGQVVPLRENAEEDERLIAEMREEIRKGSYVVFFPCCVTGRVGD